MLDLYCTPNTDQLVILYILRMTWCGVVWYDMVWCGMTWCGMTWCGVV